MRTSASSSALKVRSRSHSPKNENKKTADVWTNFATVGEGLSSGASNLYWGLGLADVISTFGVSDETYRALSWGLGLGLTAFAIGSMYAHRKLNIYHQHAHSHGHGHSHGHEEEEPLNEPLIHAHDCESEDESHLSKDHIMIEIPEAHCTHHNHTEQLSIGQKAALFADFVSHTGDVCGPITAGVDAFTKIVLKTSLPPWGNTLVQAGAAVVGGITAVANVRSCKHAIVSQNKTC